MKKLLVMIAAIIATQLSPAFATERDAIERAQAAFDAQLALECVSDAQIDWVTEDAVYQYALSGIDVSLRMEGRSVVAAHLCALSAVATDASAENIHYFPTLDPEVVYVQYDLVPVDGAGKSTKPLLVIQMRDDKIARFTQLSKSPESLEVLKATKGVIN
jgi:hypothetical protein